MAVEGWLEKQKDDDNLRTLSQMLAAASNRQFIVCVFWRLGVYGPEIARRSKYKGTMRGGARRV